MQENELKFIEESLKISIKERLKILMRLILIVK